MDALVMAGGKGRRMGGAEKPMVALAGKPLLSYVLEALLCSTSVERIYVAVSPGVPRTVAMVKNYPDDRVSAVITPGSGYIEDAAYAVRALALYAPLLVLSADLPLLTPAIVDRVVAEYAKCGREALSVRVSAAGAGGEPDLVLTDTGSPTIPAGINVVHGAHMDRAQEEYALVMDDPVLAVNVNYRKDLTSCAQLLSRKQGGQR